MEFDVIQHPLPPGITVLVRTVGQFAENCYVVACPKTKKAVIIDPGAEVPAIASMIQEAGLEVTAIWNTHGHIDHVGGNKDMKDAFPVPLLYPQADEGIMHSRFNAMFAALLNAKPSPKADRYIVPGETLEAGTLKFKVLSTPGHTPGGMSFYGHGVVFSGDALFRQSIGRTDLEGGNLEQLLTAIKSQLLTLPEETIVFSGHGPSTTIGEEKRNNPFLSQHAFHYFQNG